MTAARFTRSEPRWPQFPRARVLRGLWAPRLASAAGFGGTFWAPCGKPSAPRPSQRRGRCQAPSGGVCLRLTLRKLAPPLFPGNQCFKVPDWELDTRSEGDAANGCRCFCFLHPWGKSCAKLVAACEPSSSPFHCKVAQLSALHHFFP